jgi:1,4-alpha-glucan branching enzyme
MRILLLTSDFPPLPWSGIGVAVASQARALAEAGMEIHVLVAGARRQAQLRTGPVLPGLTVHALGCRRFPVDPRDFDWVHLHSLRLAGLAQEIRRRFALRLAYTVHGFPDLEIGPGAVSRYWSTIQRRLLQQCDRVVFLSRTEQRHGYERAAGNASRACIIPNGVPAPTENRLHASRGPIVFAGRLTLGKGIDLFAEIAKRLGPQHLPGVVLAGGHGDRPGTAAAIALATDAQARTTLAGWLDRTALDRLFGRAALVLVPSRYEPFGLVPLEAMRMGAPVLVSDTGGLADTVERRWRLASRHADDWAHAASALLVSDTATRDLTRPGRRRALQRFSIESIARRLITTVYAS